MTLRIRLGPLVYFQVEGENCHEINRALQGFDELNRTVDAMCSDLAERVYPEGVDASRPAGDQEGAS
jgi:hypothetical protein